MAAISRDEWLAALGEADVPLDPDALTISEFAKLTATGRSMAARRLEALVAAGKAVCVQKLVTCCDGRPMRVRAFALVKPTKARKRG